MKMKKKKKLLTFSKEDLEDKVRGCTEEISVSNQLKSGGFRV